MKKHVLNGHLITPTCKEHDGESLASELLDKVGSVAIDQVKLIRNVQDNFMMTRDALQLFQAQGLVILGEVSQPTTFELAQGPQ